jgi:WD40 repeat protein
MATSIFTVGGTVQANKRLYLTREADEELFELCRSATFAYVLAPRQMGKSSLMLHTAQRLKEDGVRSVIIDLTQLGTQVTAEAWYLGLLTIIEDQLMLETGAVQWWKAHAELGITQRLTRFFEEVLLNEVDSPIVIFVDEIDTTLSLNFTDDFFAAIRYFYQARSRLLQYQRLSFVLIGVATPGDLIRDPSRTPFNIGQRLDMTDFTFEEALPLTQGLNLPPDDATRVLHWVLDWTGGHPYLTQRICRTVAQQKGKNNWTKAEIDELVANTFFGDKSEQDNNIQFVRDMLTKRATDTEEVLLTYRDIRAGKRPVLDQEQSLTKSHLKLSGVVKRKGQALQVRNAIYRTVFDEKWIKEHLPINWAKRLKQALGIIAASLALALIMGGLAVYAVIQQNEAINQKNIADAQAQQAIAARNITETRRQEADTARQQSDRLRKQAQLLAVALRSQTVTDPELGLLLTSAAAQQLQENQLEDTTGQIESSLRQTLQASPLRAVLKGQSDALNSVAFSPDGRLLVTGSEDGTARIWETGTGKLLFMLKGHSSKVKTAIFSPDSKKAITFGNDDTVRLWDTTSGQQTGLINTNANSIAVSPDGKSLLTADADKTARIWQVATGQLSTELKGHEGKVNSANFSFDGKLVVTGSDDGTVRLWSVADGKELEVLQGQNAPVIQVNFSPDNTKVLSLSVAGFGSVKIWETSTGKELTTLRAQLDHQVNSAVFSPDSKLIVTTGIGPGRRRFAPTGQSSIAPTPDPVARLWEIETGKEHFVFRGHTGQVVDTVFSPDGKLLITGSLDGTAAVWEVSSGQRLTELRGHTNAVTQVAISPDGRYIATSSADKTARIWENKSSLRLTGGQSDLLSATFSSDGKLVATGSDDGTIRIWDALSGQTVLNWRNYSSPVSNLIFTKDNKNLITGSIDGYTRVWDVATGKELFFLKGNRSFGLGGLALSQDNRYIYTANPDVQKVVWVWELSSGKQVDRLLPRQGGFDGNIYFNSDQTLAVLVDPGSNKASVLENNTGKELLVLQGHTAEITGASFSPDSKLVATSSQDGTARIWDTATGKELVALRGHSGPVNSIAFSPNGKFVVTSSADATARLWDAITGRELAVIHGHQAEVTSASFSPEGNSIVTTSRDHTAQIYTCDICGSFEQVLTLAKQRVTHELTREERNQYGLE